MFGNQKGPLFYIVRHCATFSERKTFFKTSSFFPKKSILRFLSLRYSADFGRSRLVFLSVPSGVSQGSMIDPLLLFVNDFAIIVLNSS